MLAMPEVLGLIRALRKAWDHKETVQLSRMACYYFDVREGARFPPDGEGCEFVSLDAADPQGRSERSQFQDVDSIIVGMTDPGTDA